MNDTQEMSRAKLEPRPLQQSLSKCGSFALSCSGSNTSDIKTSTTSREKTDGNSEVPKTAVPEVAI